MRRCVQPAEAPNARHNAPAAENGAPAIPVPADPPPEASSLTYGEHLVLARMQAARRARALDEAGKI